LAEGYEGKWVLIKAKEIVGMWDRREDAFAAATERYLMEPCLVKQVLSQEPLIRGPILLLKWGRDPSMPAWMYCLVAG
jgi:hypothetical protein